MERYIKNEGMHGNFTGRVVYTDLVYFNALAVDKVIDGEYEWGFSWWTVLSEKSFWRNYRKMFKNIEILQWRNTRTIYDGGEMDPAETTGSSGGGSGRSGCSGGSGSLGGRGGITDWSGGSTGGGGSSGKESKIVYSKKIPAKFIIQSNENTCVPACIANILNLYDVNATEKQIIDILDKNYPKLDIKNEGLHPDNIKLITESLFETKTFTSYKNAIDNGNVVLTNIIGHSVVVVGYNSSNGYLTIMDPSPTYKGETREVPQNYPGSLYSYEISGVKL